MAGWMYNTDAVYEQTKGLRSLTIGYLKIRDSGIISNQDSDLILAWFRDVAGSQKNFYDHVQGCRPPHCFLENHRAASAAYALAAVGIASDDRALFSWGLRKARDVISSIDSEGFLPNDFVGRFTLQFHLESAAALTQLAEFAELNHSRLYAYRNGALHRLIHTSTAGIADPSIFVLRSHARQRMPATLEGWEIGWTAIYERRFPDPLIASLLAQSNDAASMPGAALPLAQSSPGSNFPRKAYPCTFRRGYPAPSALTRPGVEGGA